MSDYGPTPTSNATLNGTTTDIPIGAVVPDGTTTPVATAGGPSYVDTGKTKAPASVYIKDGNNATQGTTTDTAVVGDNPGTLSAKLRGLTKIFNDIWDSVNHRMNVAVQNGNPNGSNTSANAQPVTIATDQLPLSGVQADATANPTVSQISVFPMGFNGTTWDRLKSDNTGARRVSLYGKNAAAGDTAVLLDSSGRIQNNIVQIGGQSPKLDNTNELGVSLYGKQTAAGDTPVLVDASGRIYVNVNSLPALPAGSNLIGGAYLVDSAGTNKAAVDASGRQLMNVGQIGGQAPTLDNTSIQAVSMRGKGAGTAGDTALLLDSTGRALIGISTTALFTTTQTTVGSGTSGDLDVSKLREVSIDLNTTAQAGTNPTIQFFWERKGADGIYYKIWQSAVLTVAANTISTSIGAGMAYNQSLGTTGRLEWVVGGTATPTWTFTPNVYGK